MAQSLGDKPNCQKLSTALTGTVAAREKLLLGRHFGGINV